MEEEIDQGNDHFLTRSVRDPPCPWCSHNPPTISGCISWCQGQKFDTGICDNKKCKCQDN